MEKLGIAFPFAYPSGNLFKKKSGWKYLMGWNKKTDQWMKDYFLVKKWNAKERRKVTVTRYGSRELDFENLADGMKPLFDGLKRALLIVDDSPKWIDREYIQKKCKRTEEKTEVLIEWIDQHSQSPKE